MIFEKHPDMSRTLQIYSRHKFLERILNDVLVDITICKHEGWDWKEYPRMIQKEMERIIGKCQ